MLALSRKNGEAIWIGDDIQVVVAEVKNGRVRLAIAAPENVAILRGELRPEALTGTAPAKGKRPKRQHFQKK